MARQFYTQALVVAAAGLVVLSCISTPAEVGKRSVRLSIPAGAARVALLGSAEPNAVPPPLDPIGRPRAENGLAVWSRDPDRMTLVDVPTDALRTIAALRVPDGFRSSSPNPVDRILMTDAETAQVAGLAELAAMLAPEARLEVVVPPGADTWLREDPRFQDERLIFRVPTHGERIELSPTTAAVALRVPLSDGSEALGYGIEGIGRRLLYLPRLGPLDRLSPGLLDLVEPAQIVLLDGRRYHADSPLAPNVRGGGPSVGELLEALDGIPIESHQVLFTSLTPGNPLLNLASREARLLELARRALATDGTEWSL